MPNANPTPQQALLTARIFWAAMVIGLFIAGGVMIFVVQPRNNMRQSDSGDPFVYLPFLVYFVAVPVGLFMRGQTFKRGWVGDVVTTEAYVSGNIVAWACCEGSAFASLIFYSFVTRNLVTLVPYGLGIATILLLFPNGKALLPNPPAGAVNPADNPYSSRR